MTSYRKMRRQARHARRSGLQPMMVINSGDQLPESIVDGGTAVGVAVPLRTRPRPRRRCCWRPAGGCTPPTAHVWPVLAALAAVAACALVIAGAKAGLAAVIERLYAATLALAAGGWLAASTASARPLAAAASSHRRRPGAVGAVVGAPAPAGQGPHRTQARGLARHRPRGRPGRLTGHVRPGGRVGLAVPAAPRPRPDHHRRDRQIPALESALGTFRGAVRVYPTPDDLANRCELRVLDLDPHAGAITWPGPSVTSITEPIDLGPFEDAAPCRFLLRRHGLVGGSTGSGKSGGLNVLMGNLVACPDVVIWAIDLKRGMELGPWAACLGRLATTPDQARALLADAVAIVQARAASSPPTAAASGNRPRTCPRWSSSSTSTPNWPTTRPTPCRTPTRSPGSAGPSPSP